MSDIIQHAKHLAELKVPPLQAEITVHEDEDPRYTDDCLVQIIEKDDEYSIWYEEGHGGYEHGKLHFAHVFAAAPELAQELAEETYEYIVQVKRANEWQFYIGESISPTDKPGLATGFSKVEYAREFAKIETEYPTRIVRRRVSPVEEIE